MKTRNWPKIVNKFHESGLSQSEFARKNGLQAGSLSYNLKRHGKTRRNGKSEFVQVGAPEYIKIETQGGVTLSVPSTISPEALRRIVGALHE